MKAYHVNHIRFTHDKAIHLELEIELVSLMIDRPIPKSIQISAGYVMCDRYLKTEPLFSSTHNAHFRSTSETYMNLGKTHYFHPNRSAYEKRLFAVAYL